MGMKCIGVDVGGTSVKIGLFEITGELLDKWEVKTRKEEGGTHILPDVARSIRARMEERGLSLKTDLAGIGLGVPGPVMPDGFVEVCVNLGWRRMNPQEELSRLLDGVTVKSGNDANVAALGEMWQGGGKGYKDLVMITLGTGVGGGVIIDEKIIASSSPALAASSTSLAVTSAPYSRRADGLSLASIFLLASLAMPVAEQICSTQPTPPQLQCSHSSSLT